MSSDSIVTCAYQWVSYSDDGTGLSHDCIVVISADKPHHTHICKCWSSRSVGRDVNEISKGLPRTVEIPDKTGTVAESRGTEDIPALVAEVERLRAAEARCRFFSALWEEGSNVLLRAAGGDIRRALDGVS